MVIRSPANSRPFERISVGRNPEIWLPVFASRIALDFVLPGFDLPEIGSGRFSWLMDPLSLDELEAAFDLCNNFCPGLDELLFSLFKVLPPEVRLCLLDIYNYILRKVGIGQKSCRF
jgi:hypothetical protein